MKYFGGRQLSKIAQIVLMPGNVGQSRLWAQIIVCALGDEVVTKLAVVFPFLLLLHKLLFSQKGLS